MNGKLVVTAIIWIGVFVLLGNAFTTVTGPIAQANPGELLGLAAIMIIGAAIGTGALWAGDREREDVDSRGAKGKRHKPTRVERLVEGLDDDEVYELEALLLDRDEERRSQIRQ